VTNLKKTMLNMVKQCEKILGAFRGETRIFETIPDIKKGHPSGLKSSMMTTGYAHL
jgi:hypothetical protein